MAASNTTSLTRRTRWVLVGAAAVVAALIVVMLGIVPRLVLPGGDDEGSCRVTAEGLEHRAESRRLGVDIPPDHRPGAELGDRYNSMDGCVSGDDDLARRAGSPFGTG